MRLSGPPGVLIGGKNLAERRQAFANDPANLLAVSGPANSSKSDRGPGEWLPINASYRCTYVASYLAVTVAYDLPITRADHQAAQTIAPQRIPRR